GHRALVDLLPVDERVTTAELVGEQTAQEEQALRAARRLVESCERADANGFRTGGRLDVRRVDDVTVGDLEHVVACGGEQRTAGERGNERPSGLLHGPHGGGHGIADHGRSSLEAKVETDSE